MNKRGRLSECKKGCQNARKVVRMQERLSECKKGCQNARKVERIQERLKEYVQERLQKSWNESIKGMKE